MTIIPIIVTVILLVLVIIYITRPLFTILPETKTAQTEDTTRVKESAYQGILEHIREVDFEYNLGKLSQQEHEEKRAALVREAANILRDMHTSDSHTNSRTEKLP